MDKLFEFDKDYNPIPRIEVLAIKEFANIWKQSNKELAFKELSAVWFIASKSLTNPYAAADLETDDEYYSAVGIDVFDNIKWKPTKDIVAAISKFKEKSFNENQDELDSLMAAKRSLKTFFKEFDPNSGEALTFQKYIDSLGKLDKLIIEIQKRINSGSLDDTSEFGGSESGAFEDD